MIAVTHNLEGVLYRLRRIPVALERARVACVQADRWSRPLRNAAEAVLMAQAGGDARLVLAIGRFLNTFGIEPTPLGFRVTMGYAWNLPEGLRSGNLTDLQGAYASRDPANPHDLFSRTVADFRQLILEWVGTPAYAPHQVNGEWVEGGKRRDARDFGKSDEEIADLITYILLTDSPSERTLAARTALLPHILNFLRLGNGHDLSPETIQIWLLAVLEAWRNMIRRDMPVLFRQEFHRAMNDNGLAL